MSTGLRLVISDLHLSADRPDILERLAAFLVEYQERTAELYILGDLFEAWVGDDDDDPLAATVAAQLRQFTRSGAAVYFMHGNRDFLVGQAFADRAGLTLLTDPTLVHWAGAPTLLMHGDTLCTDDTAYQQFRATVRDPAWQQQFLAQPLAARKAFAAQARAQSEEHTHAAAAEIMDVNEEAVAATFAAHQVSRIVHGHTHRPFHHHYANDRERIVLGDWYTQSSMLIVTDHAIELRAA